MHGADLAVLIAYFATMTRVGFAYSGHMKSLDSYFADDRQLSCWLGGISFLVAYVSALSIVVYACPTVLASRRGLAAFPFRGSAGFSASGARPIHLGVRWRFRGAQWAFTG